VGGLQRSFERQSPTNKLKQLVREFTCKVILTKQLITRRFSTDAKKPPRIPHRNPETTVTAA